MNALAAILSRRWLANVLTVALMLVGGLALWQLPMAEKPVIDAGEVTITTDYPGASAEEVEANVTAKLEEQLLSVAGIDQFTSSSGAGSSRIEVRIDPAVSDLDEVYQAIRDAVNRVTDLPVEVTEQPLVWIKKSSNLDFMVVGIGSDLPYAELRTQARQLELQLRRLSGIGEVLPIDLRQREFWIELEPAQLSRYQLTATEVADAIAQYNLLSTAGSIDAAKQQLEIVLEAKLDSVEKLAALPLQQQPLVRLGDVASIHDGFERQQSLSLINGKRSIGFDLRAAEGADVVATSEAVRALLAAQQQRLGSDYQLAVGFDVANEIRARFEMVKINGLSGLALVLLVLALVLHRRLAPWVALSIPFCLLGTIAVLAAMGQILDSYTMAALILIIGIVVDDSVVISERISANLQQQPPLAAVLSAIKQVAPAIAVSIVTTIIAFLPLLWLPGDTGKLLYVMPLTISIALAFSFLDATVVVPAHLLRQCSGTAPATATLPAWMRRLQQGLTPLIAAALDRPKRTIVAVLVLATVAIAAVGQRLPLLFFPTDGAYLVAISASMPADLSLEQSWQLAQQVDQMLQDSSDVVGWYGEVNETSGNWEISLSPAGQRTTSAEAWVQRWQQQSQSWGLNLEFDVDGGGPPGQRPVDLRIVGGSDKERQQLAEAVVAKLANINGVIAPQLSQYPPVAQLNAEAPPQWLQQQRISPDQVSSLLRLAIEGQHVSRLFIDDEEVRYRLVLEDNDRSPSELAPLLLRNSDGQLVQLGQLLRWHRSERAEAFEHHNGLRSLRVSAQIDSSQTDPLTVEQALLSQFADYSGSAQLISVSQAQETRDSMQALALSLLLALLAMLLAMVLLFDEWLTPLLALLVMPAAVAVALLLLWLHGKPLSFFACIGLLGMTGVVVNNALVLLYHYRQLNWPSQSSQWPAMLLEGAISRVRPMLITTLTTVAGLLPLAYGIGGYDNLMSPIALVIGWGTGLSAPLVLLLVPAGYLLKLRWQHRG
ncbi:efflux RND transporter permease subunit [Ferrimonas senticii]|uniref:efflux RND transporter permease subunit n=1 Tax=Ferrimonas senticii TaxID=394566 RepID=UPI000403ECB1|nr:efflux RND transporter permease subunit [Ferrimonas senticii]